MHKDKSVTISAISGASAGGIGWAMSVAFPDSIPPIFGYVGFGVFTLGALLYPVYRLGAKYPGVRRRLPRFLQAELPVERDVWMIEAMVRVCTGAWPPTIEGIVYPKDNSSGRSFSEVATTLIPQAARDGKLPVWGVIKIGATHERVPDDFWRTGKVAYQVLLNSSGGTGETDDPTDPRFCQTTEVPTASPKAWKELMTSRAAVDELWPSK